MVEIYLELNLETSYVCPPRACIRKVSSASTAFSTQDKNHLRSLVKVNSTRRELRCCLIRQYSLIHISCG